MRRPAFCLVQDRDVAAAESREAVAYLNGALWYITIAQEKYSGKYFQAHYGVDDDNVIIVKAGDRFSRSRSYSAQRQRPSSYSPCPVFLALQQRVFFVSLKSRFANRKNTAENIFRPTTGLMMIT